MSAAPVSPVHDEPLPREDRLALRLSLAAFGLMFAAGGVLWLRFGADIFFDSLNAALGCF